MAFRPFEEDPFFRGSGFPRTMQPGFPFEAPVSHGPTSRHPAGMQLMHRRDPFAMGMSPFGMGMSPFGMGMSPFGMGMSPFDGMSPFGSMFQQLATNPGHNAQSFSQSTVMSFSSNGPGETPRMYQATTTTKTAPGGVKETRKAVRDSETATQKTLVSHHIGDRSHTIEREYNAKTKEGDEHHDFVNLDETDAHDFNTEWETKTKHTDNLLEGPSRHSHHPLPITHEPGAYQDRTSKRRHPSLSVDNDQPSTEHLSSSSTHPPPHNHHQQTAMPQHHATTTSTNKRSRVKFDERRTHH